MGRLFWNGLRHFELWSIDKNDTRARISPFLDFYTIPRPQWPSDKVSTSGPEGRRFETSIPLKIRRVWGLLHPKSYVVAKRPPVSVARKFGEGCASSNVVLVI
ncbi:hypothetical protein AVEN_12976-1 [Araneus ventricosus]|uniref:Uncharacterized protein n=1 Tax=Araneus ventricosus TaxID=182803 RepID=A0A4Y2QIT7_ARAVE|nr:hypothetical protein AVEN_12976-1 [Araneus ventricosus]